MPSSVWSGSISFGLVSVPVKLTTATRSRDVSFNQLEEGTGARIRYKRVSEQTGEEVPYDKIVKGYEIRKGSYVIVDSDELKAFAPTATHTIEIEDFVDLADIDPLYFEQPYYVIPDKNAAKPYRLLVEAMTGLQKVALGRIVIRSKEHLVAIRPVDGVLCVETMRYADEVVGVDALEGVPGDEITVNDRELQMARQLIEALSGEFEPDKYHDEYREQLLDLIERKAAGEDIVAEPQAEAPAKVLDLMAALEASLAKAGGASAGDEAADQRAPAPAKRAPAKKQAVGAKKATATKKPAAAKKATRSRRSA
ncbi:MAG: Ku protein [Actinobacteria bacterium]|nr:Ku protein [Actinomycetota bacterium]